MKNSNYYLKKPLRKLFKKHGAFWAYSEKQFKSQKKEGIEYLKMLNGIFFPKEKKDEFLEGLEFEINEAIKSHHAEYGAVKIIEYEYFNHETQISGNIQELKDTLQRYRKIFPDEYTDEIISKVCRECYKKAVKNDWF